MNENRRHLSSTAPKIVPDLQSVRIAQRQAELEQIRPMAMEDLDTVCQLEKQIYPFPWTKGNFRDSIYAGYSCWVYEEHGQIIGYAIMMLAAGEANLLNLAISQTCMGKGRGRRFLLHLIEIAKGYRADALLLEVRPSNRIARRLYESVGFNEIAVRRNYYPAAQGREDAILMGIAL